MSGRLTAYVDETGDLGWSGSASPLFAMSAVVVKDESEGATRDGLSRMREALNLAPDAVVQWKKLRTHDKRLFACDSIADLPVTVIQVCMVKSLLADMNRDAEALYLYTLRLLLERVTWCAEREDAAAVVRLAQFKGVGRRKIDEYLRLVKKTPNSVGWARLADDRVRIHRPEHYELLQLADLSAGPIHSAIAPTPLGYVEPEYLLRLRGVLWRPYGEAYPTYGFKVMPGPKRDRLEAVEAAHPFLTQLG